MLKVLYALHPTLHYLLRAQAYSFVNKGFPKLVRNEYLKNWSEWTLKRMNVHLSVKGEASKKPCLLVGNHFSYLDIPVLCTQAPVLFLAKKEVSRWPVIGNGARMLNTVFVDRKSEESRRKSAEAIVQRLNKEKERIVVFPSGTTSIDENVPWRLGAFRIAVEHKVPIQAFRIRYKPKSAAFIGEDNFLPHMHQLLKDPRIDVSIEFQKAKLVENAAKEMERIRKWCMS